MNTLWGAEAKANLTLGVRLGGWRHPKACQAQRQVMGDFLATLSDSHAVGLECVLHVHGGRFPISNSAADSARWAWKFPVGKFPAFAERTYPSEEILRELKCA
jgi:hypothetical protein